MRRRFGVREADYVVRTVNAELLKLACKLGSDAAGSGGVREEDRAERDAGRARGDELERIAARRDPAHPDDREPGRRVAGGDRGERDRLPRRAREPAGSAGPPGWER